MQILAISVAHIAGALRRRHAAVLARNQIACFRHYVTEHPTRIGGVHCVVQPRAIARFRHARVKQWNVVARRRSEEHTSELQSLMRISYAVFCLKKKKTRHVAHKKQTEL